MNKFTVQILLTTYNQELYIAQAIESLLVQKTNFDYQIVIADDGSIDNTREICEEFQKKEPKKIIILPKSSNQGRFKNLEKLLKSGTAPYLAICAGDDYWIDEYKLQKQFDFLENNSDYSICYTKYIEVNCVTNKRQEKPTLREMANESESNLENFLKRWRIASSSMFLRKDVLKNFPYHDFSFLEDTHIVYYAMRLGKGKILNFFGTVYRIHINNVYGNKKEFEQTLINQKVFADLQKEFTSDSSLNKKLNYLNFTIAKHYYKVNQHVKAQSYWAQLKNSPPFFLICFPYKLFALWQKLFGII